MAERIRLQPAVHTILFLWAAEAAIARLTSDRQSLADLLLSLVFLLAVGLLPVLAARQWLGRLPRLQTAALSLAGAAPLAFVSIGLIFAPAALLRPRYGPIAALALLVLIAGWRLLAGFRFQRPISRPAGSTVILLAALLGAGLLLNRALPPWSLLASLMAVVVAAAWLASRERLAPLLLPAGLLLALWPNASVAPTWSDDSPAARADAPDVILICVDTLRADSARGMSSYQRLAREGTEFTRAQAAGPWTMPSMATVMTGLPPWSHGSGSGAGWAYVGLSHETRVLAELLQGAGYDTAAFVHNPVVSEAFGYRRGFDVWDSATQRTRWSLPRTKKTMEARPFAAHVAAAFGLWGRRSFYDAPGIVRDAQSVLAARRPERPLFLWLHFLDCHFPYRRANGLDGVPWPRRMELERGESEHFRADPWWASAEGVAALKSAYEREIAEVDGALLELLDGLGPPPERGRVVIFFSDHGEEFFEHGGIEHGHALWQELLAVPLVATGLPGRAPGRSESALVSHADLAATVLAAAGVAAPQPEDEASRMPGRNLAGAELGSVAAVSENLLRSAAPWDSEWVWRKDDLKVVFGPHGAAVYDLAQDPGEQVDRAADFADLLAQIPPRPARILRKVLAAGAEGQRAMMTIGYAGR